MATGIGLFTHFHFYCSIAILLASNNEELMICHPIVVLHKGRHKYLNICLKQAKFSNPSSRIILLGDEANFELAHEVGVEHYYIKDYFKSARDFSKIYKHHSVNNYDFELFCLQRWFVINEFIKEQKIEKFLHIDSDVLLYADLTKEKGLLDTVANYDMTISSVSGHTSFFNSQNVLNKFCNFICEIFNDVKFFEQFKNNPNDSQIHYNVAMGGIISMFKPLSDMTLLYFFSNLYDVRALNTSHIEINGGVINGNFMLNPAYAPLGSINYLVFDKNNVPNYIKYTDSGFEFVRAYSLHFQGYNKKLMPKYCTYDKNEQIKKINYDTRELEKMFDIKMKRQNGEKRSLRRIISNVIEIFIPSKSLRRRIRTKIIDNHYD